MDIFSPASPFRIGRSAPLKAAAAELRVGANIGSVPWEFQDASGDDVGFEIDLVTKIGKRLGPLVSIVNIPFAGPFAAVQSGQIDAAVSSIEPPLLPGKYRINRRAHVVVNAVLAHATNNRNA